MTHDNSEESELILSYCSLGITSDTVPPDEITLQLGIQPSNQHTKGEFYIGKKTKEVYKYPNHKWAKNSETLYSEDECIQAHIQYFRRILAGKEHLLKQLKEDPAVDISFWIWIQTIDAGIGLDLMSDDLAFLNSIANWVHFSLLTKTSTNFYG